MVSAPLQLLMVWLATQQLGLSFNHTATVATILAQASVAVLSWLRLNRIESPVSAVEVVVHVHLEVALMAAILFYSGGTTNSFAPLLLLPLVAAASLPRYWVWVTGLSTVVAYVTLRSVAAPLTHALGPMEVFRIHANGDQLSYLICATAVAYFIARMVGTTRRYEQMLADVKERQIREDSVVAIGALAAGCAHELSTPLSTMGMLVDELTQRADGNEQTRSDLRLIGQQLDISKGIVRKLTGAAQRRVEEHQQAVGIEQFIGDIVARARLLHPTVSIVDEEPELTRARPIRPDEALRQSIHVLIDNAAQSARNEVRLKTQMIGADISITVCDDGSGFLEEALAQLGRTRFSTKLACAGSGLGLVLAKLTAQRLGGTLELSNLPGGGACAQLVVPLNSIDH
jgi:two-component system, sensor histidine kinase RegB